MFLIQPSHAQSQIKESHLLCRWSKESIFAIWKEKPEIRKDFELDETSVLTLAGADIVEEGWLSHPVKYTAHFEDAEITASSPSGVKGELQVEIKKGLSVVADTALMKINRISGEATRNIYFYEYPDPELIALLVQQFGYCEQAKKKF